MILVRTSVLLSLFVCLGAFAAPPVITFETDGTYATVPPGHRIAWVSVGSPSGIGMAADTDNDGRIKIWSSLVLHDAVIADVETGEWTSRGLTESALPPYTVVPGPSGAYTAIHVPLRAYRTWGFWVRPGVGAWELPYMMQGSASPLAHAGGIIADALSLRPLGDSPAPPAGIERGDLLFMDDGDSAYAGLVDAQLDLPPAPGEITLGYEKTYAGENRTAVVKVVRLGGTAGTVSVHLAPSSTTAEQGVDYQFEAVDVTLGPGDTMKSLPLPIPDDAAYNLAERSVTFALTNPTGGAKLGRYPTQTVVIPDDDPAPVLAFGDLPSSILEGDTPWDFPIPFTVTGAFRGTLPVTLTARNAPTIFEVLPGQTALTGKVRIEANDDRADPTYRIDLRLFSSARHVVSVFASVNVTDDDPPPLVVDDAFGSESASSIKVTFRAKWQPLAEGTFTWTTVDGTAKAGTDYTAASGKGRVPHWSQEFTIPLLDDAIPEDPKTFYIDISNVAGPIEPPVRSRVAVTIYDDDTAPPALSLSAEPVSEGTGGTARQGIVRVHLSEPVAYFVEVVLRQAGGTAIPSQDYDSFDGRKVVLSPGEITKEGAISIRGDAADEDDETIVVEAKDRWGKLLATTTLTIVDDDNQSFVTVADVTVDEKPGAPTFAVFTIAFSKAPAVSGTIHYATSDISATEGQDYVAKSGTISFGPADLSKEVRVEIVDDDVTELPETFRLQLSDLDAAGVYLHRDRATATIHDDESGGTPVVMLSATSPLEGNSGQKLVPIDVRLATASAFPVTVSVTSVNGSADPASDYVPLSASITFLAGETDKQVALTVNGDLLDEDDETVVIRATRQGNVVATLTLTLRDDDAASVARIANTSVVEKTGTSATAVFRVTIAPRPQIAGTIDFTTEYATAGAADFAAKSGTLSFAIGESDLQIPIEVFGDSTTENDERFIVRLSNAKGVILDDDRAYATIYDDDAPTPRPSVSIDDVTVTETSEWTEATFTLRLSQATTKTVDLSYETKDGTATSPFDYESRGGVLAFAPGETTRTIVVRIAGDAVHEETEAFSLILFNGDGVVLPDLSALCTIADDDPKEEERRRRRAARH